MWCCLFSYFHRRGPLESARCDVTIGGSKLTRGRQDSRRLRLHGAGGWGWRWGEDLLNRAQRNNYVCYTEPYLPSPPPTLPTVTDTCGRVRRACNTVASTRNRLPPTHTHTRGVVWSHLESNAEGVTSLPSRGGGENYP